MKKITDKKIGDFLGLTRQSIYNFKKIKDLAELIRQECNSGYINNLIKIIEDDDKVVEGILSNKEEIKG